MGDMGTAPNLERKEHNRTEHTRQTVSGSSLAPMLSSSTSSASWQSMACQARATRPGSAHCATQPQTPSTHAAPLGSTAVGSALAQRPFANGCAP